MKYPNIRRAVSFGFVLCSGLFFGLCAQENVIDEGLRINEKTSPDELLAYISRCGNQIKNTLDSYKELIEKPRWEFDCDDETCRPIMIENDTREVATKLLELLHDYDNAVRTIAVNFEKSGFSASEISRWQARANDFYKEYREAKNTLSDRRQAKVRVLSFLGFAPLILCALYNALYSPQFEGGHHVIGFAALMVSVPSLIAAFSESRLHTIEMQDSEKFEAMLGRIMDAERSVDERIRALGK